MYCIWIGLMVLCKCHSKYETISLDERWKVQLGKVSGVKVRSVGTNTEYKLKAKGLFFFLPICLSVYMIQIWKSGCLYVQTLKVKVSWKRRKKGSSCGRSGTIWFLTSQDFPQLLMTLDLIYPQNLRSLCFHSGSILSEPHIYGPCLIIGSVCCFTSLC